MLLVYLMCAAAAARLSETPTGVAGSSPALSRHTGHCASSTALSFAAACRRGLGWRWSFQIRPVGPSPRGHHPAPSTWPMGTAGAGGTRRTANPTVTASRGALAEDPEPPAGTDCTDVVQNRFGTPRRYQPLALAVKVCVRAPPADLLRVEPRCDPAVVADASQGVHPGVTTGPVSCCGELDSTPHRWYLRRAKSLLQALRRRSGHPGGSQPPTTQ